MAPKRAAAPRKGRPTKAAKAALASPGAQAPGTPGPTALGTPGAPAAGAPTGLAKEVAEVIAALSQVASLTPACREMAEAMAPHCLATPRGQRHEFQDVFAGALAQLFRGEEDDRRAAVEALEADALALREEAAGAGGRLESARRGSAEAEGRKAEAARAHTAAQHAAAAARAGLAAAREGQRAAAAAAAELRGGLAALELALAESWEPLLAGSLVGKEWRKRDKALAQVAQLLKDLGTPESLVQAISTAFKAKSEARGSFAEKAIEHVKEAFENELASMKQKLEAAEATPVQVAVTEAEEAVRAAEEQEDNAFQIAITAENAWAEAESVVVDLRDSQKAFGPRAHALAQKLDAAKAALAEIAELGMRAEALARREEALREAAGAEAEAAEAAETAEAAEA